jgi:hypothetical protein
MSIRPSAKATLVLVIAGALLLAGGALYLAITERDPVLPLFRNVLANQVMAALVVWFAAAWAARRFTVGKLPNLQLNSAGLIWGGSRVALLIATVLLMTGWLAAFAFGLAVQTAFFQAAVMLLVVTAVTGIAGGAFLNSVLAFRHWHVQTPE